MRSAQEAWDVFFALVERGEGAIDLPLAWCALTAVVKGPFEEDETLAALNTLKRSAREALAPMGGATVRHRLEALNDLFVREMGFHGNAEDYEDPSNNFLDDVLKRRTGIPITLSVVLIELGRAVGLDIDPVGFPGHFLVRERSRGILCDPFGGRVGLSRADCLKILTRVFGREVLWSAEHLKVVSTVSVLARMLNNLRNCFVKTGDAARLQTTQKLIGKLERMDSPASAPSLH